MSLCKKVRRRRGAAGAGAAEGSATPWNAALAAVLASSPQARRSPPLQENSTGILF